MGRYLEAPDAGARERIVRNQKFPPQVPPKRYSGASDAVRSAFIKGGDVLQDLNAGARRLSMKPCRTPREEQTRNLCLDAIEHFTHVLPRLGLDAVTASFIGRSNGLALLLEQVRVSVYPVVLLTKRVRGEERRGALLLVICKTQPLTERGGNAVATLLCEVLASSRLAVAPAVLDPNLCMVVDVFQEAIYTAPSRRTRVMKQIRDACREIARLWHQIQARAA
jgi:hypothetical protein